MNSLRAFLSNLAQLRHKSLVQGSAWMLIAQGSSIFIQAAYFIILARVLGAEDYGIFVGIAALAAVVGPFSGWGMGPILVKNVSRDRSLLSVYWGNAIVLTVISSALLTVGCLLLAPQFFPPETSGILILLIFLADLLGLRIVEIASSTFVATQQLKHTAQIKIILTVSKLLAASGLLFFFKEAGTFVWAILYCGSTLFAALLACYMVNVMLEPPTVSISRLKGDLLEGLNFSLSSSAFVINANMDRTMLTSMSTLQATGVYGAGYRFLEVCAFPILAIAGSTYARFFQAGIEGVKGSWAFGRKLLPLAFGYGIAITIMLYVLAPFAPWVIGDEYQEAVTLIRLLSFLPLIWAVQYILSDTLTGAGFQRFVTGILIASAILNVGMNLYLIPLYSWQGAAWATISSELFKVVITLVAIAYLLNKQTKTQPPSEDSAS